MKQHCMGGSWYALFMGYGGLKINVQIALQAAVNFSCNEPCPGGVFQKYCYSVSACREKAVSAILSHVTLKLVWTWLELWLELSSCRLITCKGSPAGSYPAGYWLYCPYFDTQKLKDVLLMVSFSMISKRAFFAWLGSAYLEIDVGRKLSHYTTAYHTRSRILRIVTVGLTSLMGIIMTWANLGCVRVHLE